MSIDHTRSQRQSLFNPKKAPTFLALTWVLGFYSCLVLEGFKK